MGEWQHRSPSPWREYLTQEERDQVLALEERAADLDAERRRITALIGPIRNRAIQRARYRANDQGGTG